ncbi:helix-turn-helix transcriptional regulator [Ochrobactrum pecoris]|uniref:Helix-turn-helix transcriptional regulator n=1 Tax=Brucella pecoris TaxID=867683 RepID=A0A5C5CBW0_9HYPH|nr:helix-turn-helix transcriptional regulator [Brucella pecoris]MBB4096208.1 transcriptional regulator with XRE-family HTH domain [Brucella pecoris]NKW81771.1 helix-turn-helix transcriptional regulator [Brucella pecoris]TNV08767.1 helix-turn-helix transcriptional regulator [Brucella pecoris]
MLNEALRLIRVYHDMSKAELARALGFSRSFISELEAGNKKVTLETIERYSGYFEIPASSIMLFAERTGDADLSERARTFVADKALKMLDWASTISKRKREDED